VLIHQVLSLQTFARTATDLWVHNPTSEFLARSANFPIARQLLGEEFALLAPWYFTSLSLLADLRQLRDAPAEAGSDE